jgi:hypothetical protein
MQVLRQDDLTVIQGEDWPMAWDVLDVNGNPLPVGSGYTLKAQVRSQVRSGTVLHEWIGPSPTALLSGSTVTLLIPAAVSAAFEPGWGGVYDIELTETATGRVARLAEGTIQLDPHVTR